MPKVLISKTPSIFVIATRRFAMLGKKILRGFGFISHSIIKDAGQTNSRRFKALGQKTSQRVNLFIANSSFTAQKIKNFYQRDSEIIYPPVDLKKFYPEPRKKTDGYFLTVGRLIHYKRFDLVIEAFNRLNLPLKIVGEGPELLKLKTLAKSSLIEFIPFVENLDGLRKIYSRARALIFPRLKTSAW